MERQSPTRLTLALDIVGRIADGPFTGYHELATIKHRIDLCDTISVEPSLRMSVFCNNPLVPRDERNICCKAVALVQREFGINQPVAITITKRIPVMGGLAGGSANAATTLELLNDLWSLGLSTERLMQLGRKLGMDVPYYFIGNTAFDSEAGGICRPIATDMHLTFICAIPEFGVPTADAYKGIDYNLIGKKRDSTGAMEQFLLANNQDLVVSLMHNDFELSVFKQYPALVAIRNELLAAGCKAAVLSGSGSTIIGVAGSREQAFGITGRMRCKTIVASTWGG